MKKTIRLNQSGLRNLVRESLRRYLTEVDWGTYPSSPDFRDKDRWWKEQVNNDFPGHKVDQSNSWKETYSDLNLQKMKDDKAAAKQARVDARNKRKEERERAKRERQTKRANGEKPRKTTASMKYGDGKLTVELLPDGRVGWYLIDGQNEVDNHGEMEIEEYIDNTWLPYTETYGPGRWIPKQLVNPVAKLFKKIGMRDDNWYNLDETKIRRIVRESLGNILKEDGYKVGGGYRVGDWNEEIFRSDLRAYIEMSRDYDGSADYANAKGRKMTEVIGDLPWGVNGREFEMWLVTHGSFKADQIDQMVDNAVDWVRNKLESRPKAPRIF